MRAPIIAIITVAVAAASLGAGLCRPGPELALATIPTPTWTGTPTPTPNPPNTWAPAPNYGPFQVASHKSVTLPDGSVLVAGGVGPGFTWVEPGRFIPWQHHFDTAGWDTLVPGIANTLTVLADGRVLITNYDYGGGPYMISQVYDVPSKRWTFSGFLLTPRYDHTATLLPDGRVLVVGGANSDGPVLTAEVWDPATNSWSPAPSPAYHHFRHTATLLDNGKVLISASLDNFLGASPAELYDNGVWSMTGTTPPRWFSTATKLFDGRVLLAGGVGNVAGSTVPIDPQMYDPSSNTWSPAGSLKRTDHAAVRLGDGRVFVTGDSPPSSSAVIYDPATNNWSSVASMITGRSLHTANLLPDGRVLVVGGNTAGGITGTSEYYNPGTGPGATFTPTPTSTRTPTPTPTITPGGPPTDTPTNSPTGTITPNTSTPTPVPTSSIQDSDGDGCYDWQEGLADPVYGGMRNPFFVYDFYDVNGTRKIDAADVGLVRGHYNPFGPLPPEDVIYDRGTGTAAWAPGAPDGVINAIDIGLIRASFNHDCNFPA